MSIENTCPTINFLTVLGANRNTRILILFTPITNNRRTVSIKQCTWRFQFIVFIKDRCWYTIPNRCSFCIFFPLLYPINLFFFAKRAMINLRSPELIRWNDKRTNVSQGFKYSKKRHCGVITEVYICCANKVNINLFTLSSTIFCSNSIRN